VSRASNVRASRQRARVSLLASWEVTLLVWRASNEVTLLENLIDMEPNRTRDEASRENRDMEPRQSFPMGSVDSTVGENSQSRELRSIAPVQEIRSRGFQLFDEQPILCQPQPGEQFQVGLISFRYHCTATHCGLSQ